MGERPSLGGDGKPMLHKNGTPIMESIWPAKCEHKLTTGQILRSGIRHYAETQKWLAGVTVDDKVRDFCHEHGPVRKKWLKGRAAERKRVEAEKKAARDQA